VSVFNAGESTPVRTYTPTVNEGGLAWYGDTRLFAVSGGGSGSGDTPAVLNVFDVDEQ